MIGYASGRRDRVSSAPAGHEPPDNSKREENGDPANRPGHPHRGANVLKESSITRVVTCWSGMAARRSRRPAGDRVVKGTEQGPAGAFGPA